MKPAAQRWQKDAEVGRSLRIRYVVPDEDQHAGRHSFTPPPTIPRTSARCDTRNTMTTGATATKVARASSGRKMSSPCPPPPVAGLNAGVEESSWDRPTWIGYCLESASTVNGKKKLVQSATKLKKKTSATTGLASGRATYRKVRYSPQPSTRAASSSSLGIAVA